MLQVMEGSVDFIPIAVINTRGFWMDERQGRHNLWLLTRPWISRRENNVKSVSSGIKFWGQNKAITDADVELGVAARSCTST